MLRRRKKQAAHRASNKLFVRSLSARAQKGFVDLGYRRIPCALGRSGRRATKREGDGTTPFGHFKVLKILVRPDHSPRKAVPNLPMSQLRPMDGWCDAPGDRNYNRQVRLPYPARAEQLWRDDNLYDVIGVLDYNIMPRVAGKGSAIFLHLARPDFGPTEGCIAVSPRDMTQLLARLRVETKLVTML